MDIRPMWPWIHHSKGKVLRQAQVAERVTDRTDESMKATVRLVEATGGLAEPVVSDATDDSRTTRAVRTETADTTRLGFALKNNGYDGEFPLTQDCFHRPARPGDRRPHGGAFLPRGRRRGRAAADCLPDLWLPGQGQHRRPAVPHAPGKAEVSRVPSGTRRRLPETARERDAV